MNAHIIWVGIVPVVVFAILESFIGSKKAIIASMILGISLLGYFGVIGGFDETVFIEAALIIALGAVAIKFNKPMLYKMQPVVTGVLIGLFFAYFQFFDQPYMVKILPRMTELFPEFRSTIQSEPFIKMMTALSWQMIPLTLGHAAIVALAAWRAPTWVWAFSRLLIYPALFILVKMNVS